MKEKAAGRDGDAIVVVDPHADLVGGILEHVLESLVDRVRLIDLADERGAPGINLLDTRIFADRDRTADSVVRVAKGLWDQWGPRMQSILEHTVKSLHEADEQYTILDGLRLISDDDFRSKVLEHVNDPYILKWWARDFGGWRREYRSEALAPVQTKLSYLLRILQVSQGHPGPAPLHHRHAPHHPGGRRAVGVHRPGGNGGPGRRRPGGRFSVESRRFGHTGAGELAVGQAPGPLVVVDEVQSMPGVDYESMLSELGKFGTSFILATQSLAKLDAISRTMRDTLLANVGCLTVFQVSGSDARQLVWELGKDRVSEEDIMSLPVHHCYVRATVGTERMPAFSMKGRKPEPGDPERPARIRAEAESQVHDVKRVAGRRCMGPLPPG